MLPMASVLWRTPIVTVAANLLVLLRSYLTIQGPQGECLSFRTEFPLGPPNPLVIFIPQSGTLGSFGRERGLKFPWLNTTLLWKMQADSQTETQGRGHVLISQEKSNSHLHFVRKPCQHCLQNVLQNYPDCSPVCHPRWRHHPFTCLSPLKTSSNTCPFSS